VEKGSVPLVGVLISGRGSNLDALIRAVREGRLRAKIQVVISNVADAGGLQHARQAGIETLVIPDRQFSSRDDFDRALVHALQSRQIDLVCLAGFMRRLSAIFCDAFPHGVLNIHPSLLPAFPGTDAQGQALAHGVRVSGATVHFVTAELDAGPILLQRAVPVLDDDTTETLSARILVVEHEIYAEAVERVLHHSWHVDGRRVVFGPPREASKVSF
jgi:phosphoribosylglycinamide formyltransferase 1